MPIREDETVETLSLVPRRRHPLSVALFALAVLIVAGALAIALVPGLREPLLPGPPRPVAVHIASTPEGANVFADEEHLGTTPLEARLLPGPRRLRIVRRGYQAWRQVVDPSDSPTVEAELEPVELATLIVESQPDGASVYLDETRRGITPLRIPNVEAGPHTLLVVKDPVYEPATEHIDLQADETRRIVLTLGDRLEALYRSRIQANPTDLSNYTELIDLLRDDLEKAVAVLAQALDALKTAKAPAAEVQRFHLAIQHAYNESAAKLDAATRTRLLDSVLVLFEQLLATHLGEPTYYTPLVVLLGQAGRADDLIKVCDAVAKKTGNTGQVHYQVGRVCLGSVGIQPAITLLKRSIELNPKSYSTHYYLGSAYHNAGQLDDALREYLAAEGLSTEVSTYNQGLLQTSIARLLAARGDVPGTIERYKKAVALKAPPYYTCQWRLLFAQFLTEKGRKPEAIAQYKEIVRLAPSSSLVRQARAAIQQLQGN